LPVMCFHGETGFGTTGSTSAKFVETVQTKRS
jgi:hypothetical protein